MTDVSKIFDASHIDHLRTVVDNDAFQSSFNRTQPDAGSNLLELKLGALLSYEEMLSALQLDQDVYAAVPRLARAALPGSERVFEQWQAYVLVAKGANGVRLRELLLLTATGLAARRPTELRHLLNDAKIAATLSVKVNDDATWPVRVQATVSAALIIAARQSGRSDIESARVRIKELSNLQKLVEPSWLKASDDNNRASLTLLSLYHAAQAVIVLVTYLLDGEFRGSRGQIVRIHNEMEVLFNKSHQYADLASDPELVTWTRSVALIATKLRSDSIWSNGLNINEKIDALVRNMSARHGAVYSMLPSQQDALARNLLDPRQEAVILQMPTSSGKTLMAEFAAVQTLSNYADARIVYLTPTRALATQVRRTLGSDLSDLEIAVTAAGSAFEEDPFEMAMLANVNGVVVSTPEKMDLLLRAHSDWFPQVRLVIVDEAHLLRDGERGARLELLLANLRREHPHIRLLLLTPFVENANTIASWLSDERSQDVEVQWRPARLIVGLATFKGRGPTRAIEILWKEPHRPISTPQPTMMPLSPEERSALSPASARANAVTISRRLRALGPVLAMFPSSRVDAEKAALSLAETKDIVDAEAAPAEFRVALALAKAEYGEESDLLRCLSKGVAFHHSALSGELRYLVERLATLGSLDFIAATTTLAQGMNFPVSSVVIHSVSKPWSGPLTPAEFWNIAGRAGRVGLSEKGVVVFANPEHGEHWERYTTYLSEKINSALIEVAKKIKDTDSIKWTYHKHEGIRPFIQYIGHAVASLGIKETRIELERLISASLAGKTLETRDFLLRLARRYVAEISAKDQGYMKTADQTGLASFSFDQLYASIGGDPVLTQGDAAVLREPQGLKHLIDALAKLPELALALDKGGGTINTALVAEVVHQWMNGASVREIAPSFSGDDEAERVREAGKYVFGKVSQTVSWGTHAYLRGRSMYTGQSPQPDDERQMLPAYIQYGVNSPGSVMAAMLGVPRQAASGVAAQYASKYGELRPDQGGQFRSFLETSPVEVWRDALSETKLGSLVSADDMRRVWRDAQGLAGGD